jgi:hypothetical protein
MLTNEKIKKRPDLYLEIKVVHRGLDKDMKLFLQKERFHILFVYLTQPRVH